MSPAQIERRIRTDGDVAVLDRSHHHRAWLEDALGRIRGRDRLRDRRVRELSEEGVGSITIDADARDMIAYTTTAGWRGHRWLRHEGDRIIGEIAVYDGAARAAALGYDGVEAARILGEAAPIHMPLGELRPGRGQLATPDEPVLAVDVPPAAQIAARYLHRLWNACSLDQAPGAWRGPADAGSDGRAFVLAILAALPDAVCLFERTALLPDGRVGVLWRLHGHHLGAAIGAPSGKRARLIGSSIVTLTDNRVVAEDMLLDTLALRATPYRPFIDYSR